MSRRARRRAAYRRIFFRWLAAGLALGVLASLLAISLDEEETEREPAPVSSTHEPIDAGLSASPLTTIQIVRDAALIYDFWDGARPDLSDLDSRELDTLDRARQALKHHDAKLALEVLEQYDASHPKGRFGDEAIATRVEALVMAGRRAQATALGRKFLADHPYGPPADRIRLVTGLGGPRQ